jgi:hypothetical protein
MTDEQFRSVLIHLRPASASWRSSCAMPKPVFTSASTCTYAVRRCRTQAVNRPRAFSRGPVARLALLQRYAASSDRTPTADAKGSASRCPAPAGIGRAVPSSPEDRSTAEHLPQLLIWPRVTCLCDTVGASVRQKLELPFAPEPWPRNRTRPGNAVAGVALILRHRSFPSAAA